MIEKRRSKSIKIGSVEIGGDAPVAIQTMTNTSAEDFCSTLEQLKRIEAARCDIARLAVPNEASAEVFRVAKENGIRMPLVADIHFDYRLALAAIRSGADKIRINPGNIGAEWKVKEVAEACKTAGVPIRIGVNGGSRQCVA